MPKDTQIITTEFHEILGAFDQINDSILVIDPATERIINANQNACNLYGYSKDEFLMLKLPDISNQTINRFRERIYRVITEGNTKAFEINQTAKNGSLLMLEISPSLVTYNNQTAILCAGRDISERKAIEEKLTRSEEQYRKLVEGMNVVSWSYDFENKAYIYVSPYAETIVGYPVKKWFDGDFWYDIIHPEDRQPVIEYTDEQIKNRRNYECEYRIITQQGEIKWFREITSVITENDKVKTLQGVLIDISERRRTEQSLKESEEQLYLIFESAPIGKTLTTIDGKLLRVNSAFSNMVGYSKEELYKMDFQSLTHPGDLQRNMDLIKKTIEDGKDSFRIEKRYVKKDGSIAISDTNVSILRDEKSSPARFIAQVIDITKQKEDEAKLKETELRLGALLNNLSDIVFYESDQNGIFISENIEGMIGYSAKEFEKDTFLFESLMNPEDADRINKQVSSWQVKESPESLNFEFRLRKKDGSYIWVEDHMFGTQSPYRSYWSGFLIDITDRKNAERKLEETQNRLATILNNLPNVVFYETEKDKTFVSENINSLLGYNAAEVEADKNLFIKIIHTDDLSRLNAGRGAWDKVMQDNYLKQQFRARKKDGTYIWIEDYMYSIKAKGREYVAGFMMDISERKMTEQRLEETQMRLAAVLNNLPNVVFYENAFQKQFISENIMEMLGYPVEEFYKNPKLFDSLIHIDDIERVVNKSDTWFRSGAKGTYREVFRIKRKDGIYIWLEDHMFRSQRQDDQYYYSGVMIDITERKKIESQIEDSLKEKELLIKEIHHRVKNNLQVVSSLLKLQSVHIKDKETLDMLIDSQNRVQSMALVHQKLYQSKDLANIDLNEYVGQLLFHIQNSVKNKADKVRTEVNIQKITMGVDTAVPCGLIINELVTNSLKHGFPDDEEGWIKVTMQRKGNDMYILEIEDNGKGFPEHIDFRNTSSLGLQLVNTLVSQLEGEIHHISGNGTKFVMLLKDIG